jgi:hypothetical protein
VDGVAGVDGSDLMQLKPTIRKQPADSVPYGPDISRRGGYVYCAYDGERLIAVAATAPEARRKYRKTWAMELTRPKGDGDRNL